MSTLEKEKCGEIPVIPNGEVSTKQKPDKKDELVQILCNAGFRAHVSSLRCQEGEWSSGEFALNEICIRTFSVDNTNTTLHCCL